MQTYKDIVKQVNNSRRIHGTVYVITICQGRPGGQRYFNYFVARPRKFTEGQIIPKKYKEEVVSII